MSKKESENKDKLFRKFVVFVDCSQQTDEIKVRFN